jgi:G:T/U-mismatch repair DNA glycosylase
MPYASRKTKKGCVQVYNRKTRQVYAKCTTQKKADKQLRLLRALEYNPNFVPRSSSRGKRSTKKLRK